MNYSHSPLFDLKFRRKKIKYGNLNHIMTENNIPCYKIQIKIVLLILNI